MEVIKAIIVLEDNFQNVRVHFWFKNGSEEIKTISYADFVRSISESEILSEQYQQICL